MFRVRFIGLLTFLSFFRSVSLVYWLSLNRPHQFNINSTYSFSREIKFKDLDLSVYGNRISYQRINKDCLYLCSLYDTCYFPKYCGSGYSITYLQHKVRLWYAFTSDTIDLGSYSNIVTDLVIDSFVFPSSYQFIAFSDGISCCRVLLRRVVTGLHQLSLTEYDTASGVGTVTFDDFTSIKLGSAYFRDTNSFPIHPSKYLVANCDTYSYSRFWVGKGVSYFQASTSCSNIHASSDLSRKICLPDARLPRDCPYYSYNYPVEFATVKVIKIK